ncbi:hypothetical protein FNF29_04331 [Cafeteria roenbergensis]|uniref:Uncharacterized protein n=1 Tax=Cafeteria roenbergensis TaxID=33653 RepID=A0A5A8CFW7_CAFRO|nr:hypothetical protein FNF29_04331 [Cafeteria roenbergensis]|eukprot:KAA0151925.1 hypothetical protein FNF29_04331 [Cafeteria roenbergensis]
MIDRIAKAGSPKPQPYKWDKGDNAGLQPFFREGGASPDAWEDADALLKAKDIDEVLARLASMSAAQLSEALLAGPAAPLAARLLDAFQDGPSRARLLHLLAHSRAADLGLSARAVLIRALASEGRRLRPGSARAIADVLLSTCGSDLTRLKRSLDVGGGRHDLFRLVYRDVGGAPAAQAELLQHLALEAAAVRAALPPGGRLGMQLVSDFDDTLRQGWLDRRVPRGAPYPGAKAFVGALLGRSALLHPADAGAEGRSAGASSAALGGADADGSDARACESPRADRGAAGGAMGAADQELGGGTDEDGAGAAGSAAAAALRASDSDGADRFLYGADDEEEGDGAAGSDGGVEAGGPWRSQSALETLALAGGWMRTHRRGDAAEAAALRGMVPRDGAAAGTARGPAGGAEPDGAGGGAERVAAASAGWQEVMPITVRTPADEPAGHLVVLTARPAGAFDVLRRRTLEGLGWLAPPSATVLAGSLASGISTAAIAERKASNLTLQLALWRECCAVFLGDSGQGDAAVAAEALARHSKQVLAAFVHDVNETSPTTGDGSHKDALREAGVVLFRTYPEAAAAALRLGMIDAEDARAVASAAVEEARALLAGGTGSDDEASDAGAGGSGSGAAAGAGGSGRRLLQEQYARDVQHDAEALLREV